MDSLKKALGSKTEDLDLHSKTLSHQTDTLGPSDEVLNLEMQGLEQRKEGLDPKMRLWDLKIWLCHLKEGFG